jgi:hypothetical protein
VPASVRLMRSIRAYVGEAYVSRERTQIIIIIIIIIILTVYYNKRTGPEEYRTVIISIFYTHIYIYIYIYIMVPIV